MKKKKTVPICSEPWESYYILRRGIFPCCYGSEPIAPMSEWKEAWNSAKIRKIRKYLAKGKFSTYCLRSLSCPIVQKHLVKENKPWESPKISILYSLIRPVFVLPLKFILEKLNIRIRK